MHRRRDELSARCRARGCDDSDAGLRHRQGVRWRRWWGSDIFSVRVLTSTLDTCCDLSGELRVFMSMLCSRLHHGRMAEECAPVESRLRHMRPSIQRNACAGKGAAARSKPAKGGKGHDAATDKVCAPPTADADVGTKTVSGAAAPLGTDADAVPAAVSNYSLPKGKAKKGKKKRAKK
jgi:hypothetical protein